QYNPRPWYPRYQPWMPPPSPTAPPRSAYQPPAPPGPQQVPAYHSDDRPGGSPYTPSRPGGSYGPGGPRNCFLIFCG
ncbi:hypothetical protein C731_0502, partial [Mycolicibacterium hassiacum DSM 44199]